MNPFGRDIVKAWGRLGPQFLPFADAATPELPLGRLLRLSLFQIAVGMATVLLTGTLNRVMIVELSVPAWLVGLMVSLPLLFAPFRALVGHRSDTHRSAFGWRRVPFIWYGTASMFGGLAIMPFALLVLTDAPDAPAWVGPSAAAAAFFFVGVGIHTTQTAGLALASDLAPAHARPRVVALLYSALLVGMFVAAIVFSLLLSNFSAVRLIQVIQGAAAASVVLNFIATWKQEARRTRSPHEKRELERPFSESWAAFRQDPRATRLLVTVALGTLGFSMQDIILEPYGGQILGLSVGATTLLTAMMTGGTLFGLAVAARALASGFDPHRLAGTGIMIGIVGFSLVIFASPFASAGLFRAGTAMVGLGGGLFAVSVLVAAMDLAAKSDSGIALGAWGAVQATAAGVGLFLGGALRDVLQRLAADGALGETLSTPITGYSVVYHLEILVLFASLVALGPLVRRHRDLTTRHAPAFGLAQLPG